MKKLLVLLCLLAPSLSFADSGEAPPVTAPLDAGISDAGSASAPAPSSQLHDPTTDPMGALQDLKSANKQKPRWPLMVLIAFMMLAKVLPFLGGKLAPIGAWLSKGKRAMWLAALAGLSATAYDSLASGGTWYSAGYAAGLAFVALLSPHAPVSAQEKASATPAVTA